MRTHYWTRKWRHASPAERLCERHLAPDKAAGDDDSLAEAITGEDQPPLG